MWVKGEYVNNSVLKSLRKPHPFSTPRFKEYDGKGSFLLHVLKIHCIGLN
jgi:hypothetical protein